MKIRIEKPEDKQAIYAVNMAAFRTSAEAELVDTLRDEPIPTISLVADIDDKIVGHIFFSPVSLNKQPTLRIIGLAPMAVLPDYQNQGIGSALVPAGLDACKKAGYQAAVVLGHPEFYPRFGFLPSIHFGIDSEYDVPPEVFMMLELEEHALRNTSGRIHYHPAFAGV